MNSNQKRFVFLYGLCHLFAIYELMIANSQFVNLYEIKHTNNFIFYQHNDEKLHDFRHQILADVGKADIIIYQPIANKYGKWATEVILKSASSHCRIFRVPNLYNTAFFPLCRLSPYTDYKLFGDTTIIREIESGQTLEQTLGKYRRNELDWGFKVRMQDYIDRSRQEEEISDVKYIDFILEHYKDHQFFCDSLHPMPILIKHIYNQLIVKLGILGPLLDPLNPSITKDLQSSSPAQDYFKFKWMLSSQSGDTVMIGMINKLYNSTQSPRTILG